MVIGGCKPNPMPFKKIWFRLKAKIESLFLKKKYWGGK